MAFEFIPQDTLYSEKGDTELMKHYLFMLFNTSGNVNSAVLSLTILFVTILQTKEIWLTFLNLVMGHQFSAFCSFNVHE